MILRLAKAAALVGVDRTTLWRWTCSDIRVRACLFKPGWYSVEKLAAQGLCSVPAVEQANRPSPKRRRQA